MMSELGGVDHVREIFEKAITCVGLHTAEVTYTCTPVCGSDMGVVYYCRGACVGVCTGILRKLFFSHSKYVHTKVRSG